MDTLCTHNVHLEDGPLHLRPMTEGDWDILFVWNNDSEVLYYCDDNTSWELADMQAMYRGVSRHAYVFMIELDGRPIGECWLQEMNLERVKNRYPGLDIRRIDLMIGDKALWGRGWGTRIIRLLTRFAFEVCSADMIYNPEIDDYNLRSQRAFAKNGYILVDTIPQAPGSQARVAYDLLLTRTSYEGSPCCNC